jgi:hypothetical protein
VKSKFIIIPVYKYSVPTSEKTQQLCITRINWSVLFREIIAVYSENHMKLKTVLYKIQNYLLLKQVVYIISTAVSEFFQ